MSTAHGSPATNRVGIVTSSRFILEDSRPLSKQRDERRVERREGEREENEARNWLCTAVLTQAIRRNNLAYGESVTLYPGGGAL